MIKSIFLFFVIFLYSGFFTSSWAQSEQVCNIIKEIAEHEDKLEMFKGKEKEKLWVGSNYYSTLEVDGAKSTVLNASGHLAIVATFYEGTSLAESEKSFQKCTKYLKNCLGNTYKVTENTRKLNANGDMLKELIFRLPETKFQKPSAVTLQLWMPKEADKSHLFRVLMVFPKNGFYL